MKKLNILIADDESIIRLGLKHILEEAGHSVYEAENGVSALKLAEGCKPDLVILDIKMPKMDGIEAARLLLNRMQIPVIFLTAYGDQELVERAARIPVMGYLVKPIKETELLAMIEIATHRYAEFANIAKTASELEEEISTRRIIDHAKGLLMQDDGISEFEAYHRLQQRAQKERRTLLEVAQDLIQNPQERQE